MASEHSTDQYQQIKTQEVTGQDESPTFAVTGSKFSTSLPKENLCFAGQEGGLASTVYTGKNECFWKQNLGQTQDKSYW